MLPISHYIEPVKNFLPFFPYFTTVLFLCNAEMYFQQSTNTPFKAVFKDKHILKNNVACLGSQRRFTFTIIIAVSVKCLLQLIYLLDDI